jgi:predicted glycogen debranching enzyme
MKPFTKLYFSVEDVTVTKEIFMIHNSNTSIIRYEVFGSNNNPFSFHLSPLVAFRNFHELSKERSVPTNSVQIIDNSSIRMQFEENGPALTLKADGMDFKPVKIWYKNFQYDKENERGLDYSEDLFNPGYFQSKDTSDFRVDFIATIENEIPTGIDSEYNKACTRNRELISLYYGENRTSPTDNEEHALVAAADMHVIEKTLSNGEKFNTIIAGYPWFGDWGRDTFISLPGLTLVTGRFDKAKSILKFFARKIKNGLIPNRFEDIGVSPCYNTVDASLWFINGVYQYSLFTKDYDFIKDELFPACISIVENYKKGTDFNIKMDEDCLISTGEDDVQLTWMDAMVNGTVITPRHGKPVEINALWYNALCISTELSEKFGDIEKSHYYKKLSENVKIAFNKKFWNERCGYLYDTISEDTYDKSIRPNQIYAISLPFPVLARERWKTIVDIVHEKLYTPFGLRSLNSENTKYRPFYAGTVTERDKSYHMGVAWGYLLGPFIEAFLKAEDFSEQSIFKAKTMFDIWMGNLYNNCIGSLSEIFDAEEPYNPRGCFSQSWTIAEALRIKNILRTLESQISKQESFAYSEK